VIPLQHGTLVPGEDTYPNTPQELLQRFSGNLFVPDLAQSFYKHNSSDQVPSSALWYDTRNKALKANESSTWQNILGGNTAILISPNNGSVAANTRIFNKGVTPSSDRGVEICLMSFSPRASGNRVQVTAQVPAVTTSENDVTVFGMLLADNTPFAIGTAFCRAGVLTSLFIIGLHSPNSAQVSTGLNYTLRLGTDSLTSAVYYNRTAGTDAFGNFLTTQIVATELPVN
jgi:hypothetical protein